MQIIRSIQNRIYEIRGEKILPDFDLADLYEVETRTLNQAVKRNSKRFPKDFMFQLTKEEFKNLTSQICDIKTIITNCDDGNITPKPYGKVFTLCLYRTGRGHAKRDTEF